MTYPETICYLESLINYEKIPVYPYKESLKLERIRGFLETINNPQDSLRCIHVAGSKGKGSTCAFITYILREAGYKVGLYTSPHLSDFRERIRILNPKSKIKNPKQIPDPESQFEGMISENELSALVERSKPAIQEYNRNSKYGPLSFFEVYTALAFMYFKEQNVDFAVLETGLGGRLDATNAVNPSVCAITPISFEHTQKLGNTLREIATEKAGIIKKSPHLIVITAPQEQEAEDVFINKCREVGAKLYEVGKDITYKINNSEFSVKGMFGEYEDLKTHLLGEHQVVNAAVAIGAIEAMRSRDIKVDAEEVRRGIHNTLWPGRCEVISKNPMTVLDGAQNIASAKVLKGAVKANFKYQRLILVLGISKDKDIKGICSEFYDLADEIILTRADNPRAAEPVVLAGYLKDKALHLTDNVKKAKGLAQQLAGKDDLILVTGSLFVVGEFRNEKP